MSTIASAIVVGAGIVGAACALELARSGIKVTVIDAGPIGGGATAAGMGHIVVMDDSEPQIALTQYSQNLWKSLESQLPASAEMLHCGTLWIAADEEEMQEVHRKRAFYESRNIQSHALDCKQLYAAEPNLRSGLAGGLKVPADSVVYPPTVSAWMLEQVKLQGGKVMVYREVDRIEPPAVILADGSKLTADILINAAGAQSAKLTPGLPIKSRKGHLAITDRYPGFVTHQLVELGYLKSAHKSTGDSVAFNVQPRPTGQILLGSSRQYDNSPDVDQNILSKMIARAVEYMPGIADLNVIRVWTGFRAATPDKLPLIGHWKDNVWLATGHEGLGITTSLGTAKLLVDQILGRRSEIDFTPYLPSRNTEAAHA